MIVNTIGTGYNRHTGVFILCKRSKTIKGSIYKLILVITVFLFFLNILTTLVVNIITKDYSSLMDHTIELSHLTVSLQNNFKTMDRIISSSNKEEWPQVNEQLRDMDQQLLHIKDTIQLNENGGIYLRNLLNMYDNYKVLIEEYAAVQDQNDFVEYKTVRDIKTQRSYITTHCQLLTQEYLHYSSLSYKETIGAYTKYRNLTLAALILFIILLVSFSFIFVNTMNRSIQNLCHKAEQLSKKNWAIEDIQETKYKELDTLAKAFNNMKHEIRTYIDSVKDKAKLQIILKETQLSALQMQINPHFLFNTLNTISRIAMFNDVPEIMDLINSISKILRYSLHGKDLVPLSRELDALKAYIHIQETRFSDTIQFNTTLHQHTDVLVPPLILQPIVENAIQHGLKTKSHGGVVDITVIEEKDLYIHITDNGVGMEATLSDSKKQSHGIGIENVQQRLGLIFSDKDLLRISSNEKGTTITICIPIKEDKSYA